METGRQAYLTYYFRNSCLVLPPDREVEFVIETQTDSALVSISPYRRSPKELKELKTQLQELLDRGFIRLSTSTWGTPIDLRFGYYQLKVREQDVLRTAFRTRCFLTKRLRKCVKFEWSDARQQAFEKLKEALTNAPVLIQPVSEKELYMRQRRWLELLKDYDLSIEYHPVDLRKAVARQYFNISCVSIAEVEESDEVRQKREIESEIHWAIRYVSRYAVEEIELNPDLSYDEEPIEILASDSKVLRDRTIELVEVKWQHRGVYEATWERKDDVVRHHISFCQDNFGDEISLSGGEL
ncbi:hypothetical protein GQ457_17G002750 [Hibiscus cannabinus]